MARPSSRLSAAAAGLLALAGCSTQPPCDPKVCVERCEPPEGSAPEAGATEAPFDRLSAAEAERLGDALAVLRADLRFGDVPAGVCPGADTRCAGRRRAEAGVLSAGDWHVAVAATLPPEADPSWWTLEYAVACSETRVDEDGRNTEPGEGLALYQVLTPVPRAGGGFEAHAPTFQVPLEAGRAACRWRLSLSGPVIHGGPHEHVLEGTYEIPWVGDLDPRGQPIPPSMVVGDAPTAPEAPTPDDAPPAPDDAPPPPDAKPPAPDDTPPAP